MILLLEALTEILGIDVAHPVGDFSHVEFKMVTQQEGSSFQTEIGNEFSWSLPRDGLELGKELGARHAEGHSQLIHIKLAILHTSLYNLHHLIHELLIHGICGQHLQIGLGLTTILLLQHDATLN